MELALCINDNQINLFLQKRLLLQSGITRQVITFTDGQEALEYYSTLRENNEGEYPKLILLDIHMPTISGWEFLDQFTKTFLPAFPDTSVVVTSFTIDREEIEKTKEYPCIIDFLDSALTLEYLQKLKLTGTGGQSDE